MRSFFHECISLIRVLVRACTSQKRVLKTRENPSENKKLFSLTHGACAIFVIIARMKKNYFPLINAPVLYGLELKTSEKKSLSARLSARLSVCPSVDTVCGHNHFLYHVISNLFPNRGEAAKLARRLNWRTLFS